MMFPSTTSALRGRAGRGERAGLKTLKTGCHGNGNGQGLDWLVLWSPDSNAGSKGKLESHFGVGVDPLQGNQQDIWAVNPLNPLNLSIMKHL